MARVDEMFWPLVAAMLFLDGFDYGFSYVAVNSGIGVEANPFMAPIIFTWYLPVAKLVLLPLAAVGSSLYFKNRRQPGYSMIVFGMVAELAFGVLVGILTTLKN